ncbi:MULTISPECIES: hypothetical protein [Methylococcus]|uniref:Uncharacterized protein n=1 Tax=Methylococcus capsulatus TaxID=414 RepID=A0ABZ2F945_METCP|nr:hypothetical protein [Methylococcus sp. BF19-07]
MSLISLMVLGFLVFALGFLKYGAAMVWAGIAVFVLACLTSAGRLFLSR